MRSMLHAKLMTAYNFIEEQKQETVFGALPPDWRNVSSPTDCQISDSYVSVQSTFLV